MLARPVFAEKIVLKSGNILEASIIEKGELFFKVDFNGVPVTYYFDEIDSINGQKCDVFSAAYQPAQQGPAQAIEAKLLLARQDKPPVVMPPGRVSALDLVRKVQGQVNGEPFIVDKVYLENNVLEFLPAKGASSELSVVIFLSEPRGATWENAGVHMTPETREGPRVWKKLNVDGSKVLDKRSYTSDYYLDLSFGKVHEGKIPGIINLQLKDEQGSRMAGTFEAVLGKSPGLNGFAMRKKVGAMKGFMNWNMGRLASLGGFGIPLLILGGIAFIFILRRFRRY